MVGWTLKKKSSKLRLAGIAQSVALEIQSWLWGSLCTSQSREQKMMDPPYSFETPRQSQPKSETSYPGILPRTHQTLVWVSSQVSHHLLMMKSGVTLHPTQGWIHTWELTQPWCEYPLKCAIISWWWDQGSVYIPYRENTTPVLPHRASTNFTPWWGDTVSYGNTAQHFHPSLTFAGTGDRTQIVCVAALHSNHYTTLYLIFYS